MQKIADIPLVVGVTPKNRRIIMRLIIDRFEGKFAICETEEKNIINIERSKFPCGVKEGDIIIHTSDGYKIDNNEADKRRERIKKLMDNLWE